MFTDSKSDKLVAMSVARLVDAFADVVHEFAEQLQDRDAEPLLSAARKKVH